MKKKLLTTFIMTGLLTSLIIIGSSSSVIPSDASEESKQVNIRGIITQVTELEKKGLKQIMVEGIKEEDTTDDRAWVTITDETKFYSKANDYELSQNESESIIEGLKFNAPVEITFTGAVLESYPVQATAGKITILSPLDTMGTAPKGITYSSFEYVQAAHGLTPYVPAELPVGLSLEQIKYSEGTLISTYVGEEAGVVCRQSPNEAKELSSTTGILDENKESSASLSWALGDQQFTCLGTNIPWEELKQFADSFFPLPPIRKGLDLAFEEFASPLILDTFRPKEKTFRLFTPEEFGKFLKEQKFNQNYKFDPEGNEIIIGLFAGEKGSSGYSISTTNVKLDQQRLQVTFTEERPKEEMVYLTMMTYPAQFIIVRLPEGTKLSSVQFLTHKGEAIAHLNVRK